MIITFEGGDQAGKKTQSAMLQRKLRSAKLKVKLFSFPDYTTPIGKEIDRYLHGKRKYPAQVIHCLLAANRWERANDVIKAHARDASNIGTERPYENIGLTKTSLSGTLVPSMDTLALHWDFEQVTGSDAAGQFTVQDYSSGSADKTSRYGFLGNIVGNQHAGQGYGFPASSTDIVVNEFINSAKQRMPEVINSDDMVSIRRQDDEIYTREKRPIKYFYAIEKSMYQTISEEMINIFATIVDFNNLIGEPVNRYRQDYKDMAKIRQLFFEKIGNTPDLEKYINFYKWVDNAISKMVMQLVPASANMSEGVRNLIESHVLERNKYWTKYPTLEFKKPEPEVGAFGITELLYNWKRGHAPISNVETDNCPWWSERTERSNSVITSGVSAIDVQRNDINAFPFHTNINKTFYYFIICYEQ